MKFVENNYNMPVFLTEEEVKTILPWGKEKINDLFNEKEFPACDYGKKKVVELGAFIKYFSVRRDRGKANWNREKR